MDSSGRKRAIIGTLLVVVGFIFLLDNLGFDIEIPRHVFRWPMIFVAIGIVNLLSGNMRPAIIFLSLGTIFYLHYFKLLDISELWPVIIIIIGLTFLLRRKSAPKAALNEQDAFDEIAIFGGGEKKYTSQNLKGGKVTCVFGGLEIDLRGAKIPEGAVVEIFCMFGGVEIMVPENWKVNLNTTAIFGGFSDERKNISNDPTTTLNVRGFVMFGGGNLTN